MMRRISLLALALLALTLLLPAVAHAQATRTWISGVGDDVNPCSRTAPCKTFAGAISKTAIGGEIDCLDPGGFGAVTITKSITLDCTGTHGSILTSGTNAIVISAANGNVIIRGLSLNGFNNTSLAGIKVLAAASLIVDQVVVFGFGASAVPAVQIVPNQATNMRVDIRDTGVYDNMNGGIQIKPTGGGRVNASLTRVNLHNNVGFGLRAEDNSFVTAFQTVSSNNSTNGFLAVSTSSPVRVSLFQSVTANNGTNGVQAVGAAASISLGSNAIVDNTTGISTPSGTVAGSSPGSTLNEGSTTPGAPNGSPVGLQ